MVIGYNNHIERRRTRKNTIMTKLIVDKALTKEYRQLRAKAEQGETWKVAGMPQFKGHTVEPRKIYGKDVWFVYERV